MPLSGEITPRRTRRMVLSALLLGPVLTLGVAWSLGAWLPHRDLDKQFDSIRPERTESWAMIWVREYRRPGMARRLWWVAPSLTNQVGVASSFEQLLTSKPRSGRWTWRDWGSLERAVREADPRVRAFGADDARGWPCRALWCEIVARPESELPRVWDARGGFAISDVRAADIADLRVLPFRPVPTGFLVDSALYAILCFSLMIGAAGAIGRARARRGACVRCGYDLAGGASERCPECGMNRAKAAPAPTVAGIRKRASHVEDLS